MQSAQIMSDDALKHAAGLGEMKLDHDALLLMYSRTTKTPAEFCYHGSVYTRSLCRCKNF